LIHPKSYIHAIVKLKNGLIKIIAHDTDMKIPISNSIYMGDNNQIFVNSKKIRNFRISFDSIYFFLIIKGFLIELMVKFSTCSACFISFDNDNWFNIYNNKCFLDKFIQPKDLNRDNL